MIRAAGALLAVAFRDDPCFGVLLGGATPGSVRHRGAYPAYFRVAVREALEVGKVDASVVDGHLVGVAAWFDWEGRTPAFDVRRSIDRAIVRLLYPRGLRAADQGFAAIATLHPREPHRYLAFIAVDPALQGRGIGAALLTPALAAADRDGVPCYLETPFERTLPFYRRLGFEVRDVVRHAFDRSTVWTMYRRPRAGGNEGGP
jgi:GNAT superfamily N-acetyltransferase